MITNRRLGIHTDKPLPARRDADFYPSDAATVTRILKRAARYLPVAGDLFFLDPGAGDGAWGKVARSTWPEADIQGVELREVEAPEAYNEWITGDFLRQTMPRFDLVMGNPPYKEAEGFVRKGLECLFPAGVMVYLLRLAFLEGQGRRDGLFAEFPPREVMICSKRPSFIPGSNRTNATAFAAFLWQKGWHGSPTLSWLK